MPTSVERARRIVVLGSSGFIGSRVAASLAGSGGAHVVVLSRKPGTGLRNHNATIATADISVPRSVIPILAVRKLLSTPHHMWAPILVLPPG
ncbi:NAD-dependent epimerase/dehydratase family protein [Arthrobacter sp. MI7-26]|uniref:NAD-dependent epimerase/dehydratase family protein n=1 Tax=Arthrobacter sp. MI7-26 TaxID=2993653 RepID=UPI003A59961B